MTLAHDGQSAVLAVADSGPGMDEETRAHVFERFYRADPSRARASGGAGLGLAIVDAVVEAHGGTVEVESEPGAGTTIRVRIPLAPVGRSHRRLIGGPYVRGSTPSKGASLKRLKLLVTGTATLVLVPATAQAATGPQLWSQAGCGGCHTLSAAGSSGTNGPNLDSLRPSAQRGRRPGHLRRRRDALVRRLPVLDRHPGPRRLGLPVGRRLPASAVAASGLSTTATARIQRDLKKLGFFHGPVTGYYGPLTTAAVKRFQRSAGLKADGIWGPKSARALRHRL